jgi:RNA polymerase sigma-70 factor (ECF subfamily)
MSTSSTRPAAPADDAALVEALRAGDEDAFVGLIRAHHSVLLRMAMTYVSSRAVAEEVVQETWLAVLKGLDRFEGRSSLKTWIFRIASNIARTRAVREGRCHPFASLPAGDAERSEPSVDPDRFFPADHPRLPGRWARAPVPWRSPEERVLSGETRDVIRDAVERLPVAQRLVITLRDIEGWSADETCRALELTDGNQRVLLHRARSKVRAALERHLSPVGSVV